MRYILLASHGKLAEGMLNSIEVIIGKQNNVWTLAAYLEPQFDLKKQVIQFVKKISDKDELIIVTDILGGSINNEFMNVLEDKRIHLISGMNLALIIDLLTNISRSESLETIIPSVLENISESIKYCNLEMNNQVSDEEF